MPSKLPSSSAQSALVSQLRKFLVSQILGVIATFNDWHGNSEIVCSQYTDPRELFDERGACKECKIQCIPRKVSELVCLYTVFGIKMN